MAVPAVFLTDGVYWLLLVPMFPKGYPRSFVSLIHFWPISLRENLVYDCNLLTWHVYQVTRKVCLTALILLTVLHWIELLSVLCLDNQGCLDCVSSTGGLYQEADSSGAIWSDVQMWGVADGMEFAWSEYHFYPHWILPQFYGMQFLCYWVFSYPWMLEAFHFCCLVPCRPYLPVFNCIVIACMLDGGISDVMLLLI